MLTRRETLVGATLSFGFVCAVAHCGCATSLIPAFRECHLDDGDMRSVHPRIDETSRCPHGDEPIINKSRIPICDYTLAQTLAMLANKFDVLPGFAYYGDTGPENAFARTWSIPSPAAVRRSQPNNAQSISDTKSCSFDDQ
ncbi:hypothetical protein [Bradyrhizobium sp. Cp5.3]|uniref:hypothetical protein n=1 Tax=Bradyrhizobium sp. Cp5.3 TaxID=443598 RepID=UPI0012EC6DB2|nr:hypothetical protein [Bradyrhizobium sp. Cp5.3]